MISLGGLENVNAVYGKCKLKIQEYATLQMITPYIDVIKIYNSLTIF